MEAEPCILGAVYRTKEAYGSSFDLDGRACLIRLDMAMIRRIEVPQIRALRHFEGLGVAFCEQSSEAMEDRDLSLLPENLHLAHLLPYKSLSFPETTI